ncbi:MULTISPECIES: hypothetical protein [unclassified Streptomyces]|uniref:hypothetical protein n=1 Tax=unclassified Streptomyces TaxID=2593676 RepID=UPI003BB6D17B
MSARDDIAAHFTSDTLVDQLLDAYRAEVLRDMAAEVKALGDARGWSIWAAQYMHPDVEFVDTGALDTEEKATDTASATATPHVFIEDARLRALHNAMTAKRGEWRSSDALRAVRDSGIRGVSRGDASRLLRALVDKGLAVAHGPADGRFYTLSTKGGTTA